MIRIIYKPFKAKTLSQQTQFFPMSQNNCHFRIEIQYLFIFFSIVRLIYWISSNLIAPLTTINKDILVNDINFIIEINTINYFLNNRAQTLYDYYFETERVQRRPWNRSNLPNRKTLGVPSFLQDQQVVSWSIAIIDVMAKRIEEKSKRKHINYVHSKPH